jgi:carbon-monoxide dehydrogenase large subunit
MAITTMIGVKIHRREDPRLVSGEGRYIDDFTRPNTVFLSVVRSPHAHARIKSIDVTAATKAPGVVAVYTHKDFAKVIAGTMPAAPAFVADKKQVPARFPIAEKEVVYQGEPVAVVLTDIKYQSMDAANLVEADYEVLPAVMDLEKALEEFSPAHSDAPDNLGWDLTYIPEDASIMKEADVVVKQRILQQRLAPTPMEPRGVLAEYSRPDQSMTIWMSSQNPHFIRLFLAGALGIPETRIRVISPDVGGGFGSKISPYSEDYLVPAAAKLSGRPVKWIETRTESIQTTTHGRGQYFDVEAGAKGRDLVALKITSSSTSARMSARSEHSRRAPACYQRARNWKHVSARTVGILTNKVPTDHRGAGRQSHAPVRADDRPAG